MKLGAALPLNDLHGDGLGPRSWADSARAIEDLGFESLWTFDAVGRGFMLPDPLMALAVAATVTERVELGVGVLQLPIRNGPELAHRIFTLHLAAAGRLLLGVGPGSTEADFDTFALPGAAYRDRFARFDQQWDELRSWMADGAVGDRALSPWPAAQGGPELYLAGWRGRWVERAAAEAAGWIASAHYADDDELADGLARFRAAGGDRAVVTNLQVGADVGPAVERLHRLADIGFDDGVVLDLTPSVERLEAIRGGFPG